MRARQFPTYPVNLCIETMPVLVVGGGKVALRKILRLVEAGARVTVVAPRVEPELKSMAEEGTIELFLRPYDSGEGMEYRLVFSATGDERVDWQVSYDAMSVGTFVNVADVPERCTLQLPAIVRRGHLSLAVTSDGLAPFLSRRLRQRLQEQFGEGYATWMEAAGRFREAVRAVVTEPDQREALFDRFFTESLASAGEPRVPDDNTWCAWIGEAAGQEARADASRIAAELVAATSCPDGTDGAGGEADGEPEG